LAINRELDEETPNEATIQEDIHSIDSASHSTNKGRYQNEEEFEIFPDYNDEPELAPHPNDLEDIAAPTADSQTIQGDGMVTNWMVSKKLANTQKQSTMTPLCPSSKLKPVSWNSSAIKHKKHPSPSMTLSSSGQRKVPVLDMTLEGNTGLNPRS
jgi:hypothetical protein